MTGISSLLADTRRRGMLVMGMGLLMLLAAVWVWLRGMAAEPPYRYEMDGVPAAQATPETLQGMQGALPLRTGRVLVAGDAGQVLASFATAGPEDGPVLMRWQPAVDGPFLRLTPDLAEVEALAEVLGRHVDPRTPVLAWWDISRQLHLLSGVETVFESSLGKPLFIPAAWRGARDQVTAVETAFWGAPANADEAARFDRFADALVMEEGQGIEALGDLLQGQRAVLVLHVRDVIQLGQMRPERIGVAYRELPPSGDVHGMVRGVRGWLGEHGYSAYALMHGGQQSLKAIALTDDASGMTLAARLLPFIGNAQYDVPGATLVYRTGGFVVYEIEPAASGVQE